jgi:hypothetical protein
MLPLPPGPMRQREYARMLGTISKNGSVPVNYAVRYRMGS